MLIIYRKNVHQIDIAIEPKRVTLQKRALQETIEGFKGLQLDVFSP